MGDIIDRQRFEAERARAEAVIGICLDWADSMKRYNLRLGYPSASAGFISGYVSATFNEMCKQADATRNQIVGACIDDLPPVMNAAIYRRYLGTPFRMRDYENSLAEAHVKLMESFARKGVMW